MFPCLVPRFLTATVLSCSKGRGLEGRDSGGVERHGAVADISSILRR
jgi:hypothetical protein